MSEQFKYAEYLSGYTLDTEPNVMAYNGSGGLGAMTSKEAYERVVTSPAFLLWEYELKHGKETGK
jgi:acyl-CoA synthetase (NDP forming)